MDNQIAFNTGIIKLSPRERAVIAHCSINAELSLKETAAAIGSASHAVHYCLHKLQDSGVIKRTMLVDTFRLGWYRFTIFLSLAVTKSAVRKAFLQLLTDSPFTAWVAETAGDFDFSVGMVGRNAGDVLSFFDGLSEKYGPVIFNKVISTRKSISYFPRKYLSKRVQKEKSLTIQTTHDLARIDEIDSRILQALSSNPDLSHREVAGRIGVASTTLDFRVRKLRQEGIIVRKIYSVNPVLYGAQYFTLMLSLKGATASLRRDLFLFARDDPHCTMFLESIGEWDVEMDVEVENYRQFVSLREQLGNRFGDRIREMKAFSVFYVHKFKPYPLA